MKPNPKTLAIIFLTLVVIALGVFSFNQNEYMAGREIELKREKAHLWHVKDSLQTVINRKDEQILKSMRESAEADLIAQEAVKEAKKYQKKYEAVVFKRFANDSVRSSEIARLYPSFNPR